MSPQFAAYAMLGLAIVSEVAGSAFLKLSDGFSRLWPTLAFAALYALSFYLLAQVLRTLPIGFAYAIWAGLGLVLTALVGTVLFRQTLDIAALAGIGLILSGVVVMNAFSNSASH